MKAVIRAVVKYAANEHQLEAIGFLEGFRGRVINHHIELDYSSVSDVLEKGGTTLSGSNQDNPFDFISLLPVA